MHNSQDGSIICMQSHTRFLMFPEYVLKVEFKSITGHAGDIERDKA